MQGMARKIGAYYDDRDYFAQLYRLAAPIAFQNLMIASLVMVANVMVGQLGDDPIAAVALAGQVFFLLNLILFGVGSGSAMFTAQLWGNKDIASLRKVLGLCLAVGVLIAGIFLILSEVIPAQILGIFTQDPQVIALGSAYLRVFAWSFLFFSITSGFAAVLRSIGEVKLPLIVSVSALALNVLLNYLLIFGMFGFPRLGIQGAAIAAVISRALECLVLLLSSYRQKNPITAGWAELLGFDSSFVVKMFKPVLPVIANELLWSLAITTYSIVYARIGTSSLDAMNIVGTVDNIALVPFLGLSGAVAIMVGNKIGAGEYDAAYKYIGRTLCLAIVIAIAVGGIVLAVREPVLSLYRVTPDVVLYARQALLVLGFWLTIRSQNMILIIGAFRSGGDTRFSLVLDGLIIWVLGVPMALLGAFVLRLPVYWVYLMVMSEELTKFLIGLRRYFSRKWIHDLTGQNTPA